MINFSKLVRKSAPGIEPMSETDPPFLMDGRERRSQGPRNASKPGAAARQSSGKGTASAADEPTGSQEVASPEGTQANDQPGIARAPEPEGTQTGRAQVLRGHLDATLEQVQQARSDAEQLFALICDLEAEAKVNRGLNQRVKEFAEELERERQETERLIEQHEDQAGELARSREELERVERAREEAEDLAKKEFLAGQRKVKENDELAARIESLSADLENANTVKEKAEVDASSLRSMLAERDSAARDLQIIEAELRIAGERDADQIAKLTQSAQRKEERIIELGNMIAQSSRQLEELEERNERANDAQRELEVRHTELKVASEGRIYTLTSSLSQEQAGHRVTRKLLEEMRASSQNLTDENKQLKDQALALAQENQQIKIELGGTRSTIREYGERLSELNLRNGASQNDIERLESALGQSRKETRALRRRAGKVDDLRSENASLHDKIKSLQNTLEHYRGTRGPDASSGNADGPIVLSPRRIGPQVNGQARSLHSDDTTAQNEAKITATISKLPRAQ